MSGVGVKVGTVESGTGAHEGVTGSKLSPSGAGSSLLGSRGGCEDLWRGQDR